MKMMKIIALSILFILSIGYAADNLVYSISLKYDGSRLSQESVTLIDGDAPDRLNQPKEGFTAKVVSFNGKVLHSFKFIINNQPTGSAPREIFDEEGNQISTPKSDSVPQETSYTLVIPHFDNAKSVDIYDDLNRLILSIDVSKYSTETSKSGFLYPILGLVALAGVAGFFLYKKGYFTNIKTKSHEKKIRKLQPMKAK